jgi:hypothetical protein
MGSDLQPLLVPATILLAEPIDWSAPGERPVRLPQCRLYEPVLRLGGQAGWHHAVFALANIGVVIVGRRFRVEKARQQ